MKVTKEQLKTLEQKITEQMQGSILKPETRRNEAILNLHEYFHVAQRYINQIENQVDDVIDEIEGRDTHVH